MILKTTRFGEIEIDESSAIHFSEGLVGFPEDKKYFIMEHNPDSPFMWLQSLNSPGLAFVIMNPFLVYPDYLKDISTEEEKNLKPGSNEAVMIFSIVTIPGGRAGESTVNLMGPVVIDPEAKEGKQVILANSGYSHRHPLNLKK